jgi:hypothetical protein
MPSNEFVQETLEHKRLVTEYMQMIINDLGRLRDDDRRLFLSL